MLLTISAMEDTTLLVFLIILRHLKPTHCFILWKVLAQWQLGPSQLNDLSMRARESWSLAKMHNRNSRDMWWVAYLFFASKDRQLSFTETPREGTLRMHIRVFYLSSRQCNIKYIYCYDLYANCLRKEQAIRTTKVCLAFPWFLLHWCSPS